jgi:hypothetical protein
MDPRIWGCCGISKFRPIWLMNSFLKVITNGMNNRLAPMAEE